MLPIFQTKDQNFTMMQNSWARQINPVLNEPLNNGIHLKNISLVSGNNTIAHKLGQNYQGYLITGMRGAFVQVYEVINQLPNLNLVLNSNGAATIDLYVF